MSDDDCRLVWFSLACTIDLTSQFTPHPSSYMSVLTFGFMTTLTSNFESILLLPNLVDRDAFKMVFNSACSVGDSPNCIVVVH